MFIVRDASEKCVIGKKKRVKSTTERREISQMEEQSLVSIAP